MLPVTVNSLPPPPATLISTPLPASIALRVPAGNVPPPVSIVKIENNENSARGNSEYSAKAQISEASEIKLQNAVSEFSAFRTQISPASLAANSSTAFFTQLASSDVTPEMSRIFAQYDRLISYGYVKYKPSNAGRPAESVRMFNSFLGGEAPKADGELQINDSEIEKPEAEIFQDYVAPPPSLPSTRQVQAAYGATIARNKDIPATDLETV